MCAHFLMSLSLRFLCLNEDDRFVDSMILHVCPLKVLNCIVDCKIIYVFPNIYIAYRLLFTIPIINCESEISFKDMLSSTMGDEKLS